MVEQAGSVGRVIQKTPAEESHPMARYVVKLTDPVTLAVGAYQNGRAQEWFDRPAADAAFVQAVAIGAAGVIVTLMADGQPIAKCTVLPTAAP